MCFSLFCHQYCFGSKKKNTFLPSQWWSCRHKRDQISSPCPSVSSWGHPWSCPGFRSRCSSHCPQTESERNREIRKEKKRKTDFKSYLYPICYLCVCVCVSSTTSCLSFFLPSSLSICLSGTQCLPVCLPLCLPSELRRDKPLFVWFDYILTPPVQKFPQFTNRFPDLAKAPQSLLSHCCDNSHRSPTGVIDTDTLNSVCSLNGDLHVCALYLSVIPGNASDVIPGPHVNYSMFIHNILLKQSLIREVHCIICYTQLKHTDHHEHFWALKPEDLQTLTFGTDHNECRRFVS